MFSKINPIRHPAISGLRAAFLSSTAASAAGKVLIYHMFFFFCSFPVRTTNPLHQTTTPLEDDWFMLSLLLSSPVLFFLYFSHLFFASLYCLRTFLLSFRFCFVPPERFSQLFIGTLFSLQISPSFSTQMHTVTPKKQTNKQTNTNKTKTGWIYWIGSNGIKNVC